MIEHTRYTKYWVWVYPRSIYGHWIFPDGTFIAIDTFTGDIEDYDDVYLSCCMLFII